MVWMEFHLLKEAVLLIFLSIFYLNQKYFQILDIYKSGCSRGIKKYRRNIYAIYSSKNIRFTYFRIFVMESKGLVIEKSRVPFLLKYQNEILSDIINMPF